MADDKHVFPLTTRQFSATFLDFQRNSRGYNGKIEPVDQDVTKRLLNPFLPDSIPQCHHFGKAMWAIAKECTVIQRQSTNQNTDLNLPTCHFNSEGDSKVTPSRVVEPPPSSELPLSGSSNKPTLTSCKIPSTGDLKTDFIGAAVWNEASKIKTTFNGTDQNQNTVISEHSMSPNSDYHFPDCLQQQSSGSFEGLCNEAHVKNILSTTGAVSNRSSSHFENYIELANLEPGTMMSTDCHLKNGAEKRVDDGVESKHDGLFSDDEKFMKNEKNFKSEEPLTPMPSVSGIENTGKDTAKGRNLCDVPTTERKKALKESLHKEHHILPLPLYKKGNYSNMPISTSLTANLNLEALLSVLRSEKKTLKYANYNDSSIYGKVAVLYGFQQNATVSVLQAEEVGLYDYISGTVNGLQQAFSHDESESQDIKSPFSSSLVGLDLDAFLTHFHHLSRTLTPETANGGNSLKEHSAVAWLLTSPALGVTLDRQVQEKLNKVVEILSTGEHSAHQQCTASNNACFSTQWYNLLVIIDEYRFVEKDIPLVEVYKFCTSRDINLVNFDLN